MHRGPSVGLMGFGRFGRAFGDLLADAEIPVAAWDPEVSPPDDVAARSIDDLARRSTIIVVAAPVRLIGAALGALDPHLRPDHVVMDVASVKIRPAEEMQRALGTRIPWVATHPLFGPMNVARGDRSLTAIVCPNEEHPHAVETARSLYETIGCSVVEQMPDDHDMLMARTHAIAFFVAKGLIDTGVDDVLPHSPPSFQALAQTIETVRADAGHLFLAIQRDNPEAAAARIALMNALSRVHDDIQRAPEGSAPDESTTITDPAGDPPPELIETRDLIDDLDRELIRLLARRTSLAGRAGSIKARRHRPVRDPERESRVLEDRRRWAGEAGLATDGIESVFEAILRLSRDAQT